ncbi:hypothetical protein [Candidatus Palauibacter sp.]|uniref:hypothetical protein n=1 Tax=Candidatus Palauibacter sp. TaxID=3101350 RepID=UPI003B59488C
MRRSTPRAAAAALLAGVVFLLLPRPQSAQAHQHGAQAHEHGAGGSDAAEMAARETGPPRLPEDSPLIEVRLRERDREAEIVIGPVALPAGAPHLRPQVQLAELPVVGWLHGFSWEMRDRDGNPLPDRLLHHVNVIDPDNRELFSAVPRRVLAAGRETSSETMPGLLGYPLAPGTRVLVSAMFAPRPDQSFDEAYLHIRLPFTPAEDPGLVGPFDVYPFYLDVMGPVGEKEFPLPPGTHGMSWEGSPAVDGRILGIGGHLHDYGDWIRLEDVTAGKVVWETAPTVDGEGRTVGIPTSMLWWRGGVRIRKDHVYRISVQYSNPMDRPAPDGGMGAIGGILLADKDAWPEFSREHPDYIEDLRNTLEKPNEADHAHGHQPGSSGSG